MAMLRTVLGLAVTAMLIHVATAANFTVGGANGGWDTSTNVQSWASSQSFSVGDNLVFQYQPNHDVVEVSKADYDSCQASNPIQTDTGGNTVIPLSSAGKRYFICGTIGHCSQGMKVEIDTLATTAATPPQPAATPATPPQPAAIPTPTPTPTPPPASSPAAPVHSRSPKSSALPPTKSLASAPATSPLSPKNSPASSPDVPSTESSANSPSPKGAAPPPGQSSATKVDALVGSAVGLGLAMVMMLLAQSF